MKIYLDMVGCRLNQSEIETFGRQFHQAGHSLVSKADGADLVVINSCSVTAAAESDSRQKVRQAVRAGAKQVIVTGCYATLSPTQITALADNIQVIGNLEKDTLVPAVLHLPELKFERRLTVRQPIPGARLRTRAFIKVQDGCDNYCTYCITRLARGASKSRSAKDILSDIQSALESGCQEMVLTGVHLGSWGYDFDPSSNLGTLIKLILEATKTPRLHLSSIEPWDITEEFLNLWRDPRLCRHLHLPLQSGCVATLQRMGRKITPAAYAKLIEQARQIIPGVSITTDIITGFPGETDTEFAESLAFVIEQNFAGGHVFTYSPRPGTAAMKLPDQVNPQIAKHRNALMRNAFRESASTYRQQHISRDLFVLWEKATLIRNEQWQLSGLSDNYLRVYATSPTPCTNQVMRVHINSTEHDSLLGEILPM